MHVFRKLGITTITWNKFLCKLERRLTAQHKFLMTNTLAGCCLLKDSNMCRPKTKTERTNTTKLFCPFSLIFYPSSFTLWLPLTTLLLLSKGPLVKLNTGGTGWRWKEQGRLALCGWTATLTTVMVSETAAERWGFRDDSACTGTSVGDRRVCL